MYLVLFLMFGAYKTNIKTDGFKNIHNAMLNDFVYVDL